MSDGVIKSYREYLRPGDLRTAEDVLAWLRERALAADEGFVSRAATLDEAHADLSARLDRERRQACRRAALEHWRRFLDVARDFHGPLARVLTGLAFCAPTTWRTGNAVHRDLALALHFRAEARRP